MKLFRQYLLGYVTEDEMGSISHRRMAWLKTAEALKVGNEVTLKDSSDPEQRWVVMHVSKEERQFEPRQDWKVGGVQEARR